MSVLFRRRCRVTVAAPVALGTATAFATALVGNDTQILDLDAGGNSLRVQFKVEKSIEKSPNNSQVVITNLSELTRGRFQEKGTGARIILLAGYEDTIAQVFVGDVRYIDNVQDGPLWNTKFECGDGLRGLASYTRVSESFAAGVGLPDIVQRCASKMGLDVSGALGKIGGDPTTYANGYVAHGPASRELDKVLSSAGYEWSVQDNRLQITKPGEASTERVVFLSPDTGLVGSPELGSSDKKGKPPHLKVKALLSPDIKAGGHLELESARHKGSFRVVKVTHTGDTDGGDWYSEAECEILK